MNYLIAIFLFWSWVNVSTAETYTRENGKEVDLHSTVGIGNRVYPRYDQVNPEQMPPDELPSNEEVAEPPTTIEQDSPTRSRVVTRTLSRPSTRSNPQGDVDIGPLYVPLGDNINGRPSSPTVTVNPAQPRR